MSPAMAIALMLAQQNTPKLKEGSIHLSMPRPNATAQDVITKDGHYVWKFDDPNNEYRCVLGGIVWGDRDGLSAFTVTCAPIKDVPKEKP